MLTERDVAGVGVGFGGRAEKRERVESRKQKKNEGGRKKNNLNCVIECGKWRLIT
jgi:hypothetical protein